MPGTTTINAGTPQLSGVLATGILDVSGGSTLTVTSTGMLTLNGPGTSQIVDRDASTTRASCATTRRATIC